MKCIFCKIDSSSSKSVEHVIPESLGNSKTILPKGSVCDDCNNYFAIKVEKPVMESEEFTVLRFNQLIKNKKGRVPEIKILFGDQVVKARRTDNLDFSFNSEDYSKIETYLKSSPNGRMLIPMSGRSPHDKYISRFLAKMALEALAFSWHQLDGWNEYLINHAQLEPIRHYARYANNSKSWSFSRRRIYNENSLKKDHNGEVYQVINEWDILITGEIEHSEYYFVIALFGVEYAINLGGDCMDGYYHWLDKHGGTSPLYHGKNNF